MLEVVLSGLVTGFAIAIPIGAVGALLVALAARTSIRTGSAAALGVATVDGAYAAVAVVGGAAIADRLEPYAGWLRAVSALVLSDQPISRVRRQRVQPLDRLDRQRKDWSLF